MRKIAPAALVVLVMLVAAAAAGAAPVIGIGVGYQYQLGLITDFSAIELLQQHSATVELRAFPYPLLLGIGVIEVRIGPFGAVIAHFEEAILTAEYGLFALPLGSSPITLHLGAGAWIALPAFGVGVRAPIELRWTPIPVDKGFEPYFTVVPSVGVWAVPWMGFTAGASAGLGIRYWFGK
jgi:hypothetical protein